MQSSTIRKFNIHQLLDIYFFFLKTNTNYGDCHKALGHTWFKMCNSEPVELREVSDDAELISEIRTLGLRRIKTACQVKVCHPTVWWHSLRLLYLKRKCTMKQAECDPLLASVCILLSYLISSKDHNANPLKCIERLPAQLVLLYPKMTSFTVITQQCAWSRWKEEVFVCNVPEKCVKLSEFEIV